MTEMYPEPDLLSLRTLLVSWCAAALALTLVLPIVVVGQAAGAWTGGCSIIGVSLPVHHQAWALVNQPEIAFAGTSRAFGYWWGGSILALLVAVLVVPVMPRGATWGAELAAVQVAWISAAVGCGWQPLLDPLDGHPGRWLRLHELPGQLVWIVPLLAMLAAVVPTRRLLALNAAARRSPGQLRRLSVVLLHLGLPLVIWVVFATVLRGRAPLAAALAAALPLFAAVLTAMLGASRPSVRRLEPATAGGMLVMLMLTAGLATGMWYCGRSMGGGRVAAVLWAPDSATNNIRPWMSPVRPLSGPAAPEIEPGSPGVAQ